MTSNYEEREAMAMEGGRGEGENTMQVFV